MTPIQIEKTGRRYYLLGDTKPYRYKLSDAKLTFDRDRMAWWTSKRDLAERMAAEINAMSSADYKLCPPKKYNDLIRRHGGVWSDTHRAWLLPTAEAKQQVEEQIAADKDRAAKERERAKAAEAARKEAAKKPVEQLLAEAGRTLRGDGKPKCWRLYLGHGKRASVLPMMPQCGDLDQHKDGPWMITEVGDLDLITDDWIEDIDGWHDYPDGSGWYVSYSAVPVEPNDAERARAAAKEEAAAKAKRRAEIEALVQSSDTYAPSASTSGLTRLWGEGRAAGSEWMYGDDTRLVYTTSSYDDGPHTWELRDAALAAEALTLRTG